MITYALVGKKLGHSFSKAWFTGCFEREGLDDHRYINLETDDIAELPYLIQQHGISGFNITIPYKEAILPYLRAIDPAAANTGAVNTVRVQKDGSWKGYNTDITGFRETLVPLLKPCHTRALILGTGGAAKAVAYVLLHLGIEFQHVSRHGDGHQLLRYDRLTMLDVRNAPLIINTTPLGMSPDVQSKPDIPYEGVDKYHLLYDLIYNPTRTRFMEQGELYGAQVVNGYDMLIRQAQESRKIWTRTED